MTCSTCNDEDIDCTDCLTSSQLNGDTDATCVCGSSLKPRTLTKCTNPACNRWWHASCAGLDGLTHSLLVKIISWKCPACFKLAPTISEKLRHEEKEEVQVKDAIDDGIPNVSMAKELYREILDVKDLLINRVIPNTDKIEEVNNTASTAVKDTLNENLLRQTQTWADLFQSKQDSVQRSLEKTITDEQKKIVNEAIDSSRMKAERDGIEREKRKCNCVIRDIPESTETSNAEKRADDFETVANILNIDPEYINEVYRAGRPNPDRVRPVVVTLSSPDLARELHNYGRGSRRVNSDSSLVYWVNPDLIQADRVANYNARMEAKERKEGRTQRRGGATRSHHSQSLDGNEHRADHNTPPRRQSVSSHGSPQHFHA